MDNHWPAPTQPIHRPPDRHCRRALTGPLTLLTVEQVRAADVVADGPGRLLCYTLSKADFDALLGSREDIWRFEALQGVGAARKGQGSTPPSTPFPQPPL